MKLDPHATAFAALLLIGTSAFAQPVPPPASPAPEVASPPGMPGRPTAAMAAEPASAITGRVQQWLTNPNGDVDGMLLADGTQVGFPPHLSASLLQTFKPGDDVRVSGWRMPGAPMVRAATLTATANGRTVSARLPALGAMPAPPPPPRAMSALTAMSANGRVKQVLFTDRGDTNGVLLDSGTIVRFPPHVGAGLAPMLKVGSTLSARGWGTRNAQGSALEATGIGASDDTLQDLFAGPGREPPPRDLRRRPQSPDASPPPVPPVSQNMAPAS